MRVKRASRNIATLVMVLLLVLVTACAPTKERLAKPAPLFIDLDRKTGGFYASNLIVVAGRPSM